MREQSGEGEAEARTDTERIDGGLAEELLQRLHKLIQASDRRYVQSQRHSREGNSEEDLQHFKFKV